MAWVERGEGDYRAAIGSFQKSLGNFTLNFGKEHPNVKTVRENLEDTIRQGAASGDPEMQALLKKLEAAELGF